MIERGTEMLTPEFLANTAGRKMLPLTDREECGGDTFRRDQELSFEMLMTCYGDVELAIGYTNLVFWKDGLEM